MREGGRGGQIRTDDLMYPKHARYQLRYAPPRKQMIPESFDVRGRVELEMLKFGEIGW